LDQGSHDEEEEKDEAEAEAETTGGEKQRVRLGSDSSELKAAEEPNEAQPREGDEQPPGWYRKAGREEKAQSVQTDARVSTTTTPSADETPSQKERKRRAKGKEKAPAPPEVDEDEHGRDEDEDEDEITGSQMPAAKRVATRGGEEEEHEEGEPLEALPSVCPMCSKSVKHMDLQAREAHVNSCIDSRQHTTAEDPGTHTCACAVCVRCAVCVCVVLRTVAHMTGPERRLCGGFPLRAVQQGHDEVERAAKAAAHGALPRQIHRQHIAATDSARCSTYTRMTAFVSRRTLNTFYSFGQALSQPRKILAPSQDHGKPDYNTHRTHAHLLMTVSSGTAVRSAIAIGAVARCWDASTT
jgi:hypothetical protein